jgi:hypothetical protein
MKDNQTSEKCVCGRDLDHEIKDSLDAGCKTHYVNQTSERWERIAEIIYWHGIYGTAHFNIDWIKELIFNLLSQAKEEERERIIKEYGSFDDGCGCCALTTLKEELSKLNSHD